MIYMYVVRDTKPFAIDCTAEEFVRRMQSMLDANKAEPEYAYCLYDSDVLQCVFDDVLVPMPERADLDHAALWMLVGCDRASVAYHDGYCWKDYALGTWGRVLRAMESGEG